MSLPNYHVFIFRLTLFITFITVTYLATAAINGSIAIEVNDKVSHFFAFYALAFLVDFSFPKKDFGTLKILELLSYGLLIEVIQYFLPYRFFSLYDLAADGLGLLAYKCSIPAIKHIALLKPRWDSINR